MGKLLRSSSGFVLSVPSLYFLCPQSDFIIAALFSGICERAEAILDALGTSIPVPSLYLSGC